MNLPAPRKPDLAELVALFFADPARLALFQRADPAQVPPPYHELLVHEHHMTVAVEAFHKSPVNVRVLRKRASGRHYARMILLERQSDRRVVQFGIMRVNFDHLGDEVRREVESEATPLGRILIRHEVLRRIHLAALWRVTPGDELAGWFGPAGRRTTFGRTAVIECNGEPAVELLEIVTPED